MYKDTFLNKTEINILRYFVKNSNSALTVREISNKVKQDYKIVHTSVVELVSKGFLKKDMKGGINICTLDVKKLENMGIFAYVEYLIKNDLFNKNRLLEITAKDILKKSGDSYFTFIIFGSYAKGKENTKSDLDLLFIINDKKQEKKISSAVSSVQRTSNLKIHDNFLTYAEFIELLKSSGHNLAKEAVENHIIVYGAESYYKILGGMDA